jgi:hypothetical protein
MATLSERRYISERVEAFWVELKREGLPMHSVAMCFVAEAAAILRRDLPKEIVISLLLDCIEAYKQNAP